MLNVVKLAFHILAVGQIKKIVCVINCIQIEWQRQHVDQIAGRLNFIMNLLKIFIKKIVLTVF